VPEVRSEQLERMERTLLRLKQQHDKPEAATPAPISIVQYTCLRYLAGQPRLVSDVARFLDITTAGTTGLLDRMEEQGLVERRRDVEDRRLVWVSIAPQGLEALDKMRAWRRRYMESLFSPLSDAEVETFLSLCEKLNRTGPGTPEKK